MFLQYYGISDDIKKNKYEGFMDKYPILFRDRNLDMTKTCMCFGIECPIGWYHILEQLCTVLEFYNIEYTQKYNVGIVADQVKEKFGTLRFYYHIEDMDENGKSIEGENTKVKSDAHHVIIHEYLDMIVGNAIGEAEKMTYDTCANCGHHLDDKNRVKTSGWITYICKCCNNKCNVDECDKETDECTKTPTENVNSAYLL